jgi:hypothetical protein
VRDGFFEATSEQRERIVHVKKQNVTADMTQFLLDCGEVPLSLQNMISCNMWENSCEKMQST